jgi:hypothetical protein
MVETRALPHLLLSDGSLKGLSPAPSEGRPPGNQVVAKCCILSDFVNNDRVGIAVCCNFLRLSANFS